MLRSYVTGNAELFVFDVGHLLDLRSFPTRRSSDLHDAVRAGYRRGGCAAREEGIVPGRRAQGHRHLSAESERRGRQGGERSEERRVGKEGKLGLALESCKRRMMCRKYP